MLFFMPTLFATPFSAIEITVLDAQYGGVCFHQFLLLTLGTDTRIDMLSGLVDAVDEEHQKGDDEHKHYGVYVFLSIHALQGGVLANNAVQRLHRFGNCGIPLSFLQQRNHHLVLYAPTNGVGECAFKSAPC